MTTRLHKRSFNATRTIGDRVIASSGHISPVEAVAACYLPALRDGWRPPPLRQKWWQLWRPVRYEDGLRLALRTFNPGDRNG